MPASLSIIGRIRLRIATLLAYRRARESSLKLAQSLRFERILVICFGNIYRSPLVAARLRTGLEVAGDCEIRSAGFHQPGGRSSPSEFVSMARDRSNVDLASHRSRVVTADDLSWADTILIMDRFNWHRLAGMDADCTSKLIWLGAFGSSVSCDIPDPYGQPQQAVEEIVDRLMEGTAELVAHIVAMRNIG